MGVNLNKDGLCLRILRHQLQTANSWQAVQRETEEIVSLLQPFLAVMEEIGRVAAMNGITEEQEAVGSGA